MNTEQLQKRNKNEARKEETKGEVTHEQQLKGGTSKGKESKRRRKEICQQTSKDINKV